MKGSQLDGYPGCLGKRLGSLCWLVGCCTDGQDELGLVCVSSQRPQFYCQPVIVSGREGSISFGLSNLVVSLGRIKTE